jgi:hypothetical protein
LLLYTISATGQVAINISVFVRLMLLWPKAVSTEFTGWGEYGFTAEVAEIAERNSGNRESGNRKKGAKGNPASSR